MITLHKQGISANIQNRYADIVYSFHFENTSQISSNELQFEITIDPNAFISKFEAYIDGELFIGKTKEKKTASKEYSEAKENDENAILISQPHQNIPNLFQIKTNIDAKSNVFLTITIEQYLQKKFGLNELCIQILRNFIKYNIKPIYEHINFKINIHDDSAIYNVDFTKINNNDLVITIMDKTNQNCQITGKIMNKSIDNTHNINATINELTLKYKIKGEQNDSQFVFDNKSNTFCHIISDIITDSMIMEKDIDEGHNDMIQHNVLIPRRIVIVIDRSGSMYGIKWEKTISSTMTALKQLRNGYDRYCIILCGNEVELYPSTEIVIANDANINETISYLKCQEATGSELINDSLLKGIQLIKNDIILLNQDDNDYNFYMNQIILLTDGQPTIGETDTNKIILNVKHANNVTNIDTYNSKISVHTFGIGRDSNDSEWVHDLNHSFLKILSINNNGIYQRVKQTTADIELCRYFSILSTPILSNISIKYKNDYITDLTQTKFDILYAGNDLIICGKIEHCNHDYNVLLTISAITGKQIKENNKVITKPITILKEMEINIMETTNNAQRIWAYLKLQQFATQTLIHNDMIEMDDDEQKEAESVPLSLALKYKFVTPWTSMIVVKKKDKQQLQQQPQIQSIQQQQLQIPSSMQMSAIQQSMCSGPQSASMYCGQHSLSQLSCAGGSGDTSAPMLEVNPLTSEMLHDAKPEEKKRLIGERLFPKICVVEPRLAGKITGMLLDMDNTDLLVLLSEQRALMNQINEALAVLKDQQMDDDKIIVSLEERKGNKIVTVIRGFIEKSKDTEDEIKLNFMKEFGTFVMIEYDEDSGNDKGRKQIVLMGDKRYDVIKYLYDFFPKNAQLLYYKSDGLELIRAIDCDKGFVISPP